MRIATGFTCHVRTWPVGWGWPLIGCDPFMSIFAPESWPEDTSRLTRLRFAICLQAAAKPSSVISGPRYHLGAMWSITGKQAEEQTAFKNVIAANFQGTLQCDAYVAYGSFVKKHERNITLAGCWAHVRRNFYEAREQAPQRCGWILRQIGHLYRIEENLRRSQAGPRKRVAVRMSQSRPICQRLHRALVLFKKSRRYLPRSAFGQAIDYALSNWPLLGIYLENGRIEIDNNLVENCIRPTALGKKNWLFFGDADAGQRQRHPLHHDRELPLPRHRSLRLPARRAHQAPLDDQLAG